jgi:MFS family permease
LLLLRIGVGVGEAGGTPPSQSLLADYFPPEKRAFAQGILATAPNIGILVGLFGGAVIAEAYGWRTVFLVFGIPGVLLAALIQLTVKEPPKLKAPSDMVDQGLFSALEAHCRAAIVSQHHGGCRIHGYCGLWPWCLVAEFSSASALNELSRCRFISRSHRRIWWRLGDHL